MATHFSLKTFQYFDSAKRNRKNKAWFEKNKPLYLECVREPFAALITKLDQELASDLPKIKLNPKKVSQPLYRANRIPEDGSQIKTEATAFFSEPQTSRFEWNPGIYLSIGPSDDNNILGLGLYMTSGRQISLLRDNLAHSPDEALEILDDKKLRKRWGQMSGEKYKRFPRGFDETMPAASYMWNKQFHFSQHFTRKNMIAKSFAQKVADDLHVAMPFFSWLRETVGVYRG